MKKLYILVLAISGLGAICMAGCDGAKPETEAEVTTDGKTEQTGDEKKEDEEQSSLPAGVTVAADNVVRNKDGKAYCVVMKEVVDGDEASMQSKTVDGVKYIFCCKQCPATFDNNPAKYAVAKK